MTSASQNGPAPKSGDFLHCPVCEQVYRQPKVLPCLHVMCTPCLAQCLSESGVGAGGTFLCPSCHAHCTVPRRGVQALPDSVLHDALTRLEERKAVPKKRQIVECTGCELGNEAVRKCLECDDWLCSDCCKLHGKVKITREHRLITPAELSRGDHDSFLLESFQPLTCTKHQEALKLFCTEPSCCVPICTVCKTTLGHDGHHAIQINVQAEEDIANLGALLPALHQSIMAGEKKIANIKLEEKVTASGRKDIHKVINARLEETIAAVAKQLGDFAEHLHERVEKMAKEHKAILSEELIEAQFTQVGMRCAATFTENLLAFNRPEEVVSMARLVMRRLQVFQNPPDVKAPSWRQPRIHPPKLLSPAAVEQLFGGLTLMGELIQCVLVKSFSAKIDGDTRPVSISDVEVTEDNDIMVIDKDNKKIKVFDVEGQLLFATGQGQFKAPNRVTLFRSNGHALVKDDKTLKILDQDGSVLGSFAPGLRQPVGLSQTEEGHILVTDWDSGNVHCFAEDGSEQFHFSVASEAPAYVASGLDGHIVVSDWKKNSVRCFTRNGNLVFKYGGEGAPHGHLNHPYGVAMDSNSYLIIADNWNNSIHLVSRDGRLLRHLLTEENGLKWPQAVAINKNKHLVVGELQGLIKIYQYLA